MDRPSGPGHVGIYASCNKPYPRHRHDRNDPDRRPVPDRHRGHVLHRAMHSAASLPDHHNHDALRGTQRPGRDGAADLFQQAL